MTRSIDIPSPNGTIDAHILTPATAHGPLPGVVLFTDIGGLRPSYYDKAQKVADAGYAVLLPNVYYRWLKGEAVPAGKSYRDPDVFQKLLEHRKALTPDAQAADFATLLEGMGRHPEFAPGKIGVVGYCMTGGFAVRFAALHPDRVAAAAGFHSAGLAKAGDPMAVDGVVGTIQGRVYLGHADKDDSNPPEQIARLDHALADAHVHFTTELFKGAMHGWTAKDGPVYDAHADALHYKRLFTLLEETLKA